MKHGLSGSRIYRIYYGMLQRCYNPRSSGYHHYGNIGVMVCKEWIGSNGFLNFYKWATMHGYNDNLTIDRINPKESYCPENCRWITHSDNSSRAQYQKKKNASTRHTVNINSLQKSKIQKWLNDDWVVSRKFKNLVLLQKDEKKLFLKIY